MIFIIIQQIDNIYLLVKYTKSQIFKRKYCFCVRKKLINKTKRIQQLEVLFLLQNGLSSE